MIFNCSITLKYECNPKGDILYFEEMHSKDHPGCVAAFIETLLENVPKDLRIGNSYIDASNGFLKFIINRFPETNWYGSLKRKLLK
jgi:hypothetical protein